MIPQTKRPSTHARKLLGKAVHRSKTLSVDGILERLFTAAFNGLVYAQIWEDPDVDMAAMKIEPHHHIVAIASGGCNVLSYLTARPGRITAVDLSPAHVALLKLKLAGLTHLPDWKTFHRFFGDASHRDNVGAYRKWLRRHLDLPTIRYWEGRTLSGRRRITHFASNIYTKGLLGRFIGTGHMLARLGGTKLNGLLDASNLDEQRQFFENEIEPLFDRKLVRWLTGYRASLFGLGIPPSQYEALSEGGRMSDVLKQRLRTLACDFPISENYFAWQAFNRSYAPGGTGPMPPYLQQVHYPIVRAHSDRVDIHHASITRTLEAMPPASADRFVLLDAQDWMTDTQLNELWAAIDRAAAPGARVIFRTAGKETILPGRVTNDVLDRWNYLKATSRELGAKDRSSIYGGFHIYERKP